MNVNAAAIRLPRSNTAPLPSTGPKPELSRTPTAPAALGAPKPSADTFKPASGPSALDKAKALGGLAGGLNGVAFGIKNLVGDIQNGEGGHAIAGDALQLGKGVVSTVKGGLDSAAAFESTLKGAGKGVEVAAKVGAEGAGVAAKAAGRFAPGLNVAIAGIDTAAAANTISDPNASIAAKVTSGITAAGSIAAATNIPIVSQVGAAVSTVSSITGAAIENSGAIKDGLHKVGDFFKRLF